MAHPDLEKATRVVHARTARCSRSKSAGGAELTYAVSRQRNFLLPVQAHWRSDLASPNAGTTVASQSAPTALATIAKIVIAPLVARQSRRTDSRRAAFASRAHARAAAYATRRFAPLFGATGSSGALPAGVGFEPTTFRL